MWPDEGSERSRLTEGTHLCNVPVWVIHLCSAPAKRAPPGEWGLLQAGQACPKSRVVMVLASKALGLQCSSSVLLGTDAAAAVAFVAAGEAAVRNVVSASAYVLPGESRTADVHAASVPWIRSLLAGL